VVYGMSVRRVSRYGAADVSAARSSPAAAAPRGSQGRSGAKPRPFERLGNRPAAASVCQVEEARRRRMALPAAFEDVDASSSAEIG